MITSLMDSSNGSSVSSSSHNNVKFLAYLEGCLAGAGTVSGTTASTVFLKNTIYLDRIDQNSFKP